MPNPSSLSFKINFEGEPLIAHPGETESLHEAMTRTIAEHTGSAVVDCGRCKKTGEHYAYPITLANGTNGIAVIEGGAMEVIHYSPDDPVVQGRKVVLANDYERLQTQLSASDSLCGELMASIATHKGTIGALEREIASLRARSTVFDTDASLEDRLKAADMLTVAEVMAGSPIDAFMRHAGVCDLDTFAQWLTMRREESVKLHSRLVLEGREKDEIFDWVLSHSAAFGEALVNFKAAMAGINCEAQASESSVWGGQRTH